MKTEMENLIRDRDLFKEDVCPLERTQALAELEKLKIEVKLQKSQRKCDDLQETVTRLMEEKRVSIDREKRAEERCDKIYAENSMMLNEKSMLILDLNEKISDLRNKYLESERLVGIYREKCKCSDTRLVKMGQEIEDLRLKQLEVVKELKQQNVEANRTIDELRVKKLESDKAAKLNKSRLENLVPRIMKIKELLADMSNVNVGDLANLVDEMSKLATSEEGGNSDFPDFEGKKDGSGNGSTHDDAENVVVVSPGVRSTSNSTGIRCVGLSKKGDRNLVQHRAREDIADTVNTTPGLQSGCNPPQAESNDTVEDTKRKEPQVTGMKLKGWRVQLSYGVLFTHLTD